MPVYGDQQSQYTMNRAAYGDGPATMMMGGAGGFYGGAAQGMSNMMSDIGRNVMPVSYSPPARVFVGSYGMYRQHMGMMRGLLELAGMGPPTPFGTSTLEYQNALAGDMGERIGGAGAAMAGVGIGSTAGAFAGRMIGMGAGAAIGSIFGPVGTGIGAAVGGFAGSIGGYMFTQSALGSAIESRRGIQNFLEASSFRFVGAGSAMADPRLGGGMSRGARQEVGEFIRGRDVADPMLNGQQLGQILEQGSQLGLFNGMGNDMDGFKKRFKEVSEGVKSVSKLLHQTLEDGLKTIRDLQTIGVGPGQAGSIAMQADSLGKAAGRTGAEMIGMGMQGAEMFRGTGISMGIGFQQNMMNLASVRASRDAGALSQEAIAQAGGEEALAQRMTASSLGFTQSAFGRGSNAAFFNAGIGGAGFNAGTFSQAMMAGGGNFIGQAMQAAGNLSSPSALIKYQANQEKFLSEMGKTFGGSGLQIAQLGAGASYAAYISQTTGANTKDAFIMAMKQQGMSMPEIEAQMGRMSGAGDVFRAAQAGASSTRNKMVMEQATENFMLYRAWDRAKDYGKSMVDVVARPLNRMIDATAEGVTSWSERQMFGVQRVDVSGIGFEGLSEQDYAAARSTARSRRSNVDLNQGGLFARTAGSAAAEGAGVLGLGRFGGAARDDEITLATHLGGSMRISEGDIRKAHNISVALSLDSEKIKKLEGTSGYASATAKFGQALLEGKVSGANNLEQLSQAVYGKSVDKLTQAEGAAIRSTGSAKIDQMVSTHLKAANDVVNATQAANVLNLKSLREDFDSQKQAMAEALAVPGTGRMGIPDISVAAAQKLALAAAATNPAEKKRLLGEAGALQIKAGSSAADVQVLLHRAEVGGAGFNSAAAKLRATAAGIAGAQVEGARGDIADALSYEINQSGLSGNDLEKALAVVSHARSTGLQGDDIKILGKLGVGAGVVKQAQTMDAIRSAANSGDKEAISKALIAQGIKGDRNSALTSKIALGGNTAASAIREIEAETATAIKGTAQATAAGGAGTTGSEGAAQQTYAQQTAINTQILAVMQGLASRLGVK